MGRRAAVLDVDAVLAEALAGHETDETDAMIDATSALVAEYGLRRWSMDDVAERAGLARATVYRRFESREKLVRVTLARDARNCFAAISAAVAQAHTIEEKVLEGLVVGLELASLSPIPRLLESDPGAAIALITSETILRAGRRALVESYETLIATTVPAADRPEVEAVAEALLRLGLSMLMTPGMLTGAGHDGGGRDGMRREGMRRALAAVVGPLLSSRPEPGRDS